MDLPPIFLVKLYLYRVTNEADIISLQDLKDFAIQCLPEDFKTWKVHDVSKENSGEISEIFSISGKICEGDVFLQHETSHAGLSISYGLDFGTSFLIKELEASHFQILLQI